MTRARDVSIYTACAVTLYVLVLFGILPIPLVESKLVDSILPMVGFARMELGTGVLIYVIERFPGGYL